MTSQSLDLDIPDSFNRGGDKDARSAKTALSGRVDLGARRVWGKLGNLLGLLSPAPSDVSVSFACVVSRRLHGARSLCRVFEDNVGALELANTPKLRPRTKHLAVQLHHLRQYILNKQIAVEKVDTKYQRADIMTKTLPKDSFQFLRKTINGW